MQFLVMGYDGADEGAVARRMAARESHLALGDKLRDLGFMRYAVAMINEEGNMCGSVLVTDFPSREHLEEWLKVEPYVTGKVWQRVTVIPCKVGPSFENLRAVATK